MLLKTRMVDHVGQFFEIREVAELLGVTPRRIAGWVERGLLVPTRRGSGPGTRRHFSVESVITGMVLLRLQIMMGERDESLKWLVRKLPTASLMQLVLAQPPAKAPHVALAIINYAGANYAGTPPNITPRGEDQYQIDVAVGLELSSMQRSMRRAEDRDRPWDRFPPDARTWDEALHAGASVTFFDVTHALLTLKERLESRTDRD